MQALRKIALGTGLFLAGCAAARAGAAEDVLALYQKFAAAQNQRNLEQVGSHFIDGPQFLWVSDGKSFWGRPAALERMGQFQGAEVWRVEPALDRARIVEVTPGSAYVHLPLDLVIGPAAKPDRITFLVSMLGVSTPQGWKIAALFTTTAKPD